MIEIVYYLRLDAGYESFPSENYVDYMTNVMPVPERHCFFIPRRSIEIICEVKGGADNERILEWYIRKYDKIPQNSFEIHIDERKIEEISAFLGEGNLPQHCDTCVNYLGTLMKFSNHREFLEKPN